MAVDYRFADGSVLGGSPIIQLDSVIPFNLTTAAKMRLGMINRAYDFSTAAYGEGEFKYVKFTGACVAGDFVVLDAGGQTTVQLVTTGAKGQIGIAMASHPNAATTNDFGWVMIRGIHDGANVLSGVTAGTQLYASAVTAGRATNAVTATWRIESAYERLVTASGGNVGTVEINWPAASNNG